MSLRQLRHCLCRVASNTCLLLGACLLSATNFYAHDPGLSLAELKLQSGHLDLHLVFARADIESLVALDINKDRQVSQSEFASLQSDLESLATEAIEIRIEGQRLRADKVTPQLGESNAIHFFLEFPVAAGSKLNLNSALLGRLPAGHRQFLSIKNNQEKLLTERMLDSTHRVFEIEMNLTAPASTPALRSFRQFLILGIEHILTGYDHLLFLFGLLIVGTSLAASVKIITSFTIAHSVTLALATLDVVRISPNIVEPLIAASIVYVGLENIFSHNLKWRWLLTFGFGLVHGFGFASVLRELGIGANGSGTVIPLLSFNLGVELGQLTIAAIILPLVWKLRTRPAFVLRYVPVCSVLVTLMGGFWLVERILSK